MQKRTMPPGHNPQEWLDHATGQRNSLKVFVMRSPIFVLCAAYIGAALYLALGVANAETPPAPAPPADPKFEARMEAEKEARKQCKTEICKVFSTHKAEPGAISCDATKTWLDTDISERILSGRVSWPWGHAQCSTHIEIDRGAIAKLASEPEATVKLKQHTLKCLVDKKGGHGDESESYVVKFAIAPEVTFKNGKAAAVKLNWSDIDAPALLQGALWSAATLDSAFNVLSNSAVTQINSFMFDHCKEVGVEIAEHK